MPVQWVNRPNLDFRGFSGTIAGGQRQARAMRFASCPRAKRRRSARIVTLDGDLEVGAGRIGDADARRRSRLRAAT
jgi:bifunctional enzyme CysN/CysC